ncbi:tryptophan halogenase family protein [Marinimicrobium sp. ARAG 43.8]|uniref:tryptophan halogenase family protein n=1 Tax=Marinimicrobium sp. ARAG 43.8 TaxID=3418719 RepID=UPI003CF079E4
MISSKASTGGRDRIDHIVVVGGGTAGWLMASRLAAEFHTGEPLKRRITLLESPDIATVGVGEGTWPSMLETLRQIGLSENEFIRECDVSFKQGSRFYNWVDGKGEHYDHPFTQPAEYGPVNLAEHWLSAGTEVPFAYAVSPQSAVCDEHRAPKQPQTPEYAFNLNYGYHLNAGKFAGLLSRHSVERLGVHHILDEVVGVTSRENGDIETLQLKSGNTLGGDLFIDCTGMASRLLGEHYQVPWVSCRDQLFNDAALAVQVPTADDAPLASQTLSTAHSNGWIWDIGLPRRRGVGAVFSRSHADEAAVHEVLADYIKRSTPSVTLDELSPRLITFDPGHREQFWRHNCVAVGLSAGFIEPLEATALVLVEQSASILIEELPDTRAQMTVVAERFNRKFARYWESIIDFLKLHYALSNRRESAYWRDQVDPASMPDSLRDLLLLWKTRTPWVCDSLYRYELFPSASYQYILYGMQPRWTGGDSIERRVRRSRMAAQKTFESVNVNVKRFRQGLPRNRDLLQRISQK